MKSPYQGLKAVIATKHQKEKLVQRPFARGLGLEMVVPEHLDTDVLGTFTGEIPRPGTMDEVIVKKAKMGMEATGLSMGVASEGSFGPHPYIGFIAGDIEFLAFVDNERDFVLIERYITPKTNFAHTEANSIETIHDFLKNVGFPQHGLIVKPKQSELSTELYKGIGDYQALQKIILHSATLSPEGLAHIETDMRAHMNPLRQRAIRKVAFRLVRRLQTPCPLCQLPGWGLVGTEKGLPCESCGAPTEMVNQEVFGCVKCEYKETYPRADGLKTAKTCQCQCCNP